ncbi:MULTISPECIES: class I SAM-dependent methyltransferase [Amycolatopsis]|uniref:Class I SAM-dependent methyltransferase n=2 Tax=Amycolatopsis TaxID=1813 RepID=A0ABW5I709_9PSEU
MRQDKPFFGLDAPPIVAAYAALALAGAALIVVELAGVVHLGGVGYWLAAVGVLVAGAMVYSSLRGKLTVRDRLLRRLRIRPDDDVLDLGCGSGLMLLGAAKIATGGEAVGIDLWRGADQAGSTRERCMANARILGVAERVRLIDGDMSELPLPDGSVDVVLACVSIHNIHDKSLRQKTIREAARVLRPGGKLGVIDFSRTKEHAHTATAAGLADVDRSGWTFAMYPPVRTVTATKPA